MTTKSARPPVRRLTAREVAARAGVSVSAVSRTFTAGASVAPATRECVMLASHELSLGWVDQLDEATAEEIRRLARSPAVIMLAREYSLDALRIIIFLLAKRASAQNNRSATRVMYSLRKDLSQSTINAILLLDGGTS